jgi:PAS domain S-box-containing protein
MKAFAKGEGVTSGESPAVPAASVSEAGALPRLSTLVVRALLTSATYYVAAQIGFALQSPSTPHSVLWLPNSVLLSVLLISPAASWPVLLLAAFPAQLLVGLQAEAPVLPLSLLFLTNCADAMLGATLVCRLAGSPFHFDGLRNMLVFLVFGATLAPIVVSFADAAIVVLTGWGADYWLAFQTRVRSNVLTHAIAVPAMVACLDARMPSRARAFPARYYTEAILLFGALVMIGLGVFAGHLSPGLWPLYAPLPLLLWAAVRLGSGGTALCLLAIAFISSWGALHGRGPFGVQTPEVNTVALQFFLFSIALPLLCLSALVQDRYRSETALRSREREALERYAQLAAIQQAASVGLAFLDTSLRYASVNNRFAEYTGVAAAEHVGRTPGEVVPGLDPEHETSLRKVVETGSPSVEREISWQLKDEKPRAFLVSNYPVRAGFGEVIGVSCVLQEITERRREQQVLRQVAEGVSGSIGHSFFRLLVQHLAETLDADYAMVGEICGDRQDRIRTIAAFGDGAPIENMEYELANTPCEHALQSDAVYSIPRGVQELYPLDTMLQTLDIESYLGMGLRNSLGASLGLMVVIGRKPIEDVAASESMLQIFATRAAAELERKRAEETLRSKEAVLRASFRQIQKLAGRLITAQEAERMRIAGELHDGISQQIAALSIAMSGAKRRLGSSTMAQEEFLRLQRHVNVIADDIRLLSHELHPGVLQHAGLVAALRGRCTEFSTQYGIEVTFRAPDELSGVPDAAALCLYRVAQEALHNVAKHAQARHVSVAVRHAPPHLELEVTDDGCGFDTSEARRTGGLGLISLEERVRLNGGTLRIESQSVDGTRVMVQLPMEARRAAARSTAESA